MKRLAEIIGKAFTAIFILSGVLAFVMGVYWWAFTVGGAVLLHLHLGLRRDERRRVEGMYEMYARWEKQDHKKTSSTQPEFWS